VNHDAHRRSDGAAVAESLFSGTQKSYALEPFRMEFSSKSSVTQREGPGQNRFSTHKVGNKS
jgi:hypothetical protein